MPAVNEIQHETPATAMAAPPDGWVKLALYGTAMEAEFHAAILGNEGIATKILGANLNTVDWFWERFNRVEMFVPRADVQRAIQILANAPHDELEPVAGGENDPPPADKDGKPLVRLAAYETLSELRDAQTTLGSARISTLAPPLAPRGDKPPGKGKRFILWVAENDLQSAKSVLADEAAEDNDQPRCPQCGSWRVHEISGLLSSLAQLAGYDSRPQEAECAACRFRAELSEFLPQSNAR